MQTNLIRQCRDRLPYECCGVVFGAVRDGRIRADGFAVVRNAASNPEVSFRFDPAEWVRIHYEAQKNQRTIVGFFHSHPNGSPTPSRLDAEGWDGAGAYWIVGLSGARPEIRVFGRTPEKEWYPIPVKTVPG